ncbi:hypothetical protein GCM10025789_14700 [Tessaracoccus lubricantis]|uniref:Uncharacterized protein n=1 Tax=Tessaracoccus lubricantis TaxID=545543 RepID=A0ABP9FBD9_9ACTN
MCTCIAAQLNNAQAPVGPPAPAVAPSQPRPGKVKLCTSIAAQLNNAQAPVGPPAPAVAPPQPRPGKVKLCTSIPAQLNNAQAAVAASPKQSEVVHQHPCTTSLC